MTIQRILFPWEAKKLGISWLYSAGFKANRNAGREIITKNFGSLNGGIDVLQISRLYNLGNHMRQVSNAVRFAEIHGIECVIIPSESIFNQGMVGNVMIKKQLGSDENLGTCLRGDFFYFEKLGISDSDLERGRVVKTLRGLMPVVDQSDTDRDQGGDRLVIHLRGGDSLELNPHPLYMPPPLNFFINSIDHSGLRRVHIVFQSSVHPYITSIEQYCKDNNIEFTVSGSTLLEDFSTLLRATFLCISQGTLALAAAWLSTDCKTIYAFQRDLTERATTDELGITMRMAATCEIFGDWHGTAEQMNVLLNLRQDQIFWI